MNMKHTFPSSHIERVVSSRPGLKNNRIYDGVEA